MRRAANAEAYPRHTKARHQDGLLLTAEAYAKVRVA